MDCDLMKKLASAEKKGQDQTNEEVWRVGK
jgi:hypothetical protein